MEVKEVKTDNKRHLENNSEHGTPYRVYECPKCTSGNIFQRQYGPYTLWVACNGCGEKTTLTIEKHDASLEERKEEYDKLWEIMTQKGFKPGWVAYRYKDIFGCWPETGIKRTQNGSSW